ncbi:MULTISPECIES: helix-turn-helix domain-containing protein [Actinomadura]|uniref:Helix-turn-helix domain-containing protein n=1 Tax=Actinomadura yumaensis TaxID=111807 RepID=A0ABW2CT02_9ACTN|nr:helix-turn-helix domain-containing protein [Actinomadura sp. J1-007]MWK34154.1 helix-turn-helix domain-containing protein [Actinomadura sp. J1-007]
MPTHVSTSGRPPGDQAAFWRHVISSAFGPLHVRPPDRDGFAARLVGRTLGPIQASEVRAPAHAVSRSPRQIDRDTRECYKLGFVLRGSCTLRQNDRCTSVRAGDIVLYDLTRPVEITFEAHRILTVLIPHRAVPLPPGRVAALGGTLLTERTSTGRLVRPLLAALAENDLAATYATADPAAAHAEPVAAHAGQAGRAGPPGPQGGGGDGGVADVGDGPYAHHLGEAILELVTSAVSERLGSPGPVAPADDEALRVIEHWIESRLDDPGLTPASIALAHHVSVRQLYRLFQARGDTVSRYVRTRRLERCRRELRDPFLATQRISAIAARWGYPDAAAFSRAFRAAYGVSPSDYRAAVTGIRRRD